MHSLIEMFLFRKVGHQKLDSPRVAGHQREILDIQWNPFNDHIIASASEDTTVKIWRIPSGGLTEDLLEPLVDLRGHQRKVGLVRWHPTANGILASAAFDFKVIVWNALKAKSLCVIDCHRDTIFDLAFNFDGSRMATTSKDKKIRIVHARTGKVIQVLMKISKFTLSEINKQC
jgi:WD40 repeat protein